MIPIKPAATVMLIRERKEEVQLLLVRRNTTLSFASGFWVFPGGKIDPDEIAKFPQELDAARVAAVREVKEECDLDIDQSSLEFFVHWTTPILQKRRFSTYFFHALESEEQQVTVDGSEILEHQWLTPSEALTKARNGEIALLPPTFLNIERIIHCQTYKEVQEEFSRVKPTYVIPSVGLKDDYVHCMYEGDAGFESCNPDASGPRHRFIYNFKKAEYVFEYNDCAGYYPLNGIKNN
jgi:8-oxo-dGTP pyrophosphatase MutT (NUDIX family)